MLIIGPAGSNHTAEGGDQCPEDGSSRRQEAAPAVGGADLEAIGRETERAGVERLAGEGAAEAWRADPRVAETTGIRYRGGRREDPAARGGAATPA